MRGYFIYCEGCVYGEPNLPWATKCKLDGGYHGGCFDKGQLKPFVKSTSSASPCTPTTNYTAMDGKTRCAQSSEIASGQKELFK